MWTVTAERRVTPATFAADRIRRIVPLYWIATLGAVASIWVVPGFFWQASADPWRVAASLLFVPHAGIGGGVYPVLYQGWTLQYEMFFYAVFALCLWLPARLRLPVLAAVLAGLVALGVASVVTAGPAAETYTDPICLEFLGGAVAAWVAARWQPARATAGVILVAAFAVFVLVTVNEQSLGVVSWLTMAVAVPTIVFGAVALERAGGVPRWPRLRVLGEASYSIYLFQTFGFALASRFAFHWPVVARAPVYCAFAVAAGLLAWLWLEMPIQRALRRPASGVVHHAAA